MPVLSYKHQQALAGAGRTPLQLERHETGQMDTIISRIRKNSAEEIWVTLGKFEGHDLLNVRAYFRSVEGFRPTRKGIALDVSKMQELNDALREFIEENADVAKVVAIPKNPTEEIRVYRSEYMGHLLMNIRVFFKVNGETEGNPTHKGIAFNVNLTNEVIRSIDLAIKHYKPD